MTAIDVETMRITQPGVYEMDDVTYHSDPVPGGSLSCSGAKTLLPPSCPARFAYEREYGRPDTKAFDMGHAAHKLALGVGPTIVPVDATDWRTNDAKAQREEIREASGVPLLRAEFDVVTAMAAKLLEHPMASALFQPGAGTAEASLFWQDEESGIQRRARLDWLPHATPGRRLIIPDYKTAKSANPKAFAKSAADYGYHQQAPWYIDAAEALDLAEDPAFVFVVQEKTPPYIVTVVQLDVTAVRIGRLLNRRAIDIYAECDRTGAWPGYADDVALASLPYWYEKEFEAEL